MFCLKNLPSLPKTKLAEVPDHPETKKFLLLPDASKSMVFPSGADSLNRQSPTV
jgi:ABC-type antimicrobial peptide transport system ATPase subunit